MIGLLAPLFLLGALAAAVPVVVHLVHRERKQPLAFPSLMFLRRVPFRSARRQRIRYWLLFLMRTAALLLVATAFARPWLDRPQSPADTAKGGRDIVVLVDRSYSMSARGVWERAQRAALQAVSRGDRVAVIAFGEQAQQLARLDEPLARAQAAVRQLAPGHDITRYAPALKLAATALNTSRGPAEIVVITDRQRSGWRGIEQVEVPANTEVRVVDVRAAQARNLAITNVEIDRSLVSGRERIALRARVDNRSAQAANVPVELHMSGRVQQRKTISAAAGGTAVVRFDPMFASNTAGEVRLAGRDDVAADDVAYFTTDARTAPIVRLVGVADDARFYFDNALTAGDARAFTVHRAARLSARELDDTDVLVLLDAALPEGTLGESLREFVRQGGGVVTAGLATGRIVERVDNPAAWVALDMAHPIFNAFRRTGDEPFAHVRTTRFVRGQPSPNATVLARFDDGSPAVTEERVGRGRIISVATSFSRRAGDLVLQPAFVPFAQQMVRYAASGAHVARAYTVGNVIDVNSFTPGDRDAVVITPSRQRVRLSPSAGARTLRIDEAGVYQIRGDADAATQLIAANVDVAESDLSPLDAKLFADVVAPRAQSAVAAAVPLSAGEREQQQSVWWYLLAIAFGLFMTETLVGNRISRVWTSGSVRAWERGSVSNE